MLTSSPTILPGATSASPRTFHYATSRSPQQSPKITVPLPRRQSRHSLSRSSPSLRSPTLSKPKQYVGVDAATQYSPMEPFDPMVPLRAAQVSGPRISSSTAAPAIPTSTATATATEPKPQFSNPQTPSGPNSTSPNRSAKTQIQTLSPNKRRKSQESIRGHPASSVVASSQPSSPKRPKPNKGPPKVLPLRYEFCKVEDMVILIANMLSELIETNDLLAMKSGQLTRFHSR